MERIERLRLGPAPRASRGGPAVGSLCTPLGMCAAFAANREPWTARAVATGPPRSSGITNLIAAGDQSADPGGTKPHVKRHAVGRSKPRKPRGGTRTVAKVVDQGDLQTYAPRSESWRVFPQTREFKIDLGNGRC